MNPILSAAIGSILRWALAIGAGYLVKAGIWTGSDAETYVAAGSLALLGLGWSLFNKHRGRIKLLTALQWAQATENDVKGGNGRAALHPDAQGPEIPQELADFPELSFRCCWRATRLTRSATC